MSTVVIEINGTDVTDDVRIADASFSSQVNGAIGQASLVIKDVDQTYEFTSGDSLTVDVDGDRVWGGYVMQARKIYALPVIDASDPGGVTRLWQIGGLDYNVLFNKRIVYKASDPTGKISFEYSVDTYDDTIINDIFDNYLDISGDGLTRGGVTRIAKAILDLPGLHHRGEIASAGFTWKEMMDSVQRATGGIYYISPSKVLTYVDAETVTNTHALNDVPTGDDVGYQKFTILEDGTNLINDMLVWGAGQGSTVPVFSRSQDATSIAAHNRWQAGLFTSGLFRQASADIVSASYVYGTPQSHRGGKDDAVVFTVRVFEPTYLAGDIVDIVCGIFGYTASLPLRRMTLTFASPTEPLFDLMMTHAIDQAFGFFEYIGVNTGVHLGKNPPPPPPPPPLPPNGGGGGCTDDICLETIIFDDFTGRSETNDWGAPTYGPSNASNGWFNSSNPSTIPSASGGKGIATMDGNFAHQLFMQYNNPGAAPSFPWAHDFTFSTVWEYDTAPSGTHYAEFSYMFLGDYSGHFVGPFVYITADPGDQSFFQAGRGGGSFGDDAYYNLPSNPPANTPVNIKFQYGPGAVIKGKIWWSGPEPDWQVVTTDLSNLRGEQKELEVSADTDYAHVQKFDDFIFVVDRCSVHFDDFGRISGVNLGDGWGAATSGYMWSLYDYPNVYVNGGPGILSNIAPPGGGSPSGIAGASLGGVPFLAYGQKWRMDCQFSLLRVVDISYPVEDDIRFDGQSGSNYPSMNLAISTDPDVGAISVAGTTTEFTAYTDWVAGVVYRCAWEFDPAGLSRAKIWRLSDPEPDWMVSVTPQVMSSPINYWDIVYFTNNDGLDKAVSFYWVDFNYDGKPCYPTDACTLFDDFSRSTSSMAGWTTATPSGYGWTAEFSSPSTGHLTNYVATPGQGGTLEIDAAYVGARTADVTGGGGADPWNALEWTMVAQVRMFWDDPTQSVLFGFAVNKVGGGASVGVTLRGDSMMIGTDGTPVDPGFTFDESTGTWYMVKWNVRYDALSGFDRFKIWPMSDSEPASWLYDSGVPTLTEADLATFEVNEATVLGVTTGHYFEADTQSISFCTPASVPPAPPVPGVPASGEVCETIAHTTGGPEFGTTNAFHYGTLRVWVNSLRRYDFTFDPVAATFTFGSALSPSDVIYVCYVANGDPL